MISDGFHIFGPPDFPPPADYLFASAPAEEIGQAFQRHIFRNEERAFWLSHFNCLLVETGEHCVLIDAGAGKFGAYTGRLRQNLLTAGASLKAVDKVILSHGHPDHLGGCTDEKGDPTFPNARYVMFRREWNFWWGQRPNREIQGFNREALIQSQYGKLPGIHNQIELVDREEDIYPGVRIIPAPGHTPGQIAVLVSSGNRQLLFLGDVLAHPIQIDHPEWSGTIDMDRLQTVATRYYFLNLAMLENVLVLNYHFAFPGLGWVIRHQDRYVWLAHLVDREHAPVQTAALTGPASAAAE